MNYRIWLTFLAPLALGILADVLAPQYFWLSPVATSLSGFLLCFWSFPVTERGAFVLPLVVGFLFLTTYVVAGLSSILLFQHSAYYSHRVLTGAMGLGPLAFSVVALVIQFFRRNGQASGA